ncbi:MAG: hydrolase [Desulfitobacteriia bacterium]
MKFRIELVEYENPQPTIAIRTMTTMDDLPETMGKSFMKLMKYLDELKVLPVEPPYVAYHNLDLSNFDVEMGFVLPKVIPAKDDMKIGEFRAGKYLSRVFKGPYAGMEHPYEEMFRWMEQRGYDAVGVYYEFFYNTPSQVTQEELLTRIVMPLKKYEGDKKDKN